MGVEMPTTARRGRVSGQTHHTASGPAPWSSTMGVPNPQTTSESSALKGRKYLRVLIGTRPFASGIGCGGVPAATLRVGPVGWRRADAVTAPRADGCKGFRRLPKFISSGEGWEGMVLFRLRSPLPCTTETWASIVLVLPSCSRVPARASPRRFLSSRGRGGKKGVVRPRRELVSLGGS